MFPTEFIACEDLCGKDVTVTIEAVRSEQLRTTEGTEQKYTIRFVGKTKRLVLNKTNAKLIATATGIAAADKWKGQRITLYGTQCAAFGATVPCIRVRERTAAAPAKTPQQAATAAQAPPAEHDQPFDDSDAAAFEKAQAEAREADGQA